MGSLLGSLGVSCGPLAEPLRSPWEHLGSLLGSLGGLLGASGDLRVPLGDLLRVSGASWGTLGASLGALEEILGASRTIFGSSWESLRDPEGLLRHIEFSWSPVGSLGEVLGGPKMDAFSEKFLNG